MKFIDEAKVYIKSGDGGDGCLSFRREKYIEYGGPDGGNGGRGGHIYIQGVIGLNTLVDFRFQKHFRAKKGVHGAGRKRNGAAGKDIVLKLPIGTQIYEEDELVEDIIDTKKILLFSGGKGGLGNTNFKSSTNRAPRKITLGEKGYEADVLFKLKLIADTGLVGLPNAGKSSFMRKLTAAKTKVGEYPFTIVIHLLVLGDLKLLLQYYFTLFRQVRSSFIIARVFKVRFIADQSSIIDRSPVAFCSLDASKALVGLVSEAVVA